MKVIVDVLRLSVIRIKTAHNLKHELETIRNMNQNIVQIHDF